MSDHFLPPSGESEFPGRGHSTCRSYEVSPATELPFKTTTRTNERADEVSAVLCRKPVDVPYHGFWNFGLHIASRACGPDEENMFHNFLQAFFVGTAK